MIITKHCIKIPDSFKVRKRHAMKAVLQEGRAKNEESLVWLRTDRHLIREWRGHNLLYDLHIARQHTKDVDLNWPCRWWETILYYALSLLYAA